MNHYFQTIKPRFWVIIFAGLLIVLISLYCAQQGYIRRQQETIDALNAEHTALRSESAELNEKIRYAKTNEFIEREAHRMGLIHEGETIFQLSGASSGE